MQKHNGCEMHLSQQMNVEIEKQHISLLNEYVMPDKEKCLTQHRL